MTVIRDRAGVAEYCPEPSPWPENGFLHVVPAGAFPGQANLPERPIIRLCSVTAMQVEYRRLHYAEDYCSLRDRSKAGLYTGYMYQQIL
jgi:hypothetical protein